MVVGWKVGIWSRASGLRLCDCEVEGVPVKGVRIARYGNRLWQLEGTKNYKVVLVPPTECNRWCWYRCMAIVIITSGKHRLWSDFLGARLSMVPRFVWNKPQWITRLKTYRWSTVGAAKNKRLQLLSLVIIPSSPTSRISIFQSGWRRKKKIGIL